MRARGEEGFAGLLGLAFGLLLFVVGTLLVGYAWGVVDTKAAVEAASLQAARTFVASEGAQAAVAGARQAADASLAGEGRDPSRAQVLLSSGAFGRCRRVTIEVRYPAPLVLLPLLGHLGSGQTVSAANSELVYPYSSGLAGTATCP